MGAGTAGPGTGGPGDGGRRPLRRRVLDLARRPRAGAPTTAPRPPADAAVDADDPALALLVGGGVVAVADLPEDSPVAARWRADGVRVVVGLVTSGELVGVLALGPRRSGEDYSARDRALAGELAGRAAPAVRVGALLAQQEHDVRERERMQRELEVAQLIQQRFLPQTLPKVPGWTITACYQPARMVGGDFYDVIERPDGLLVLVVGDVTDKGVPAALVMSSTQALVRAAVPRLGSPSAVLAAVNEQLCEDIPAHMFVTCLVLTLDPTTGAVVLANAGHPLPQIRSAEGTAALRATGMPLGLMPGSDYDEVAAELALGDVLVLHSDGLIEARDPTGEMFGLPRLVEEVAGDAEDEDLLRGSLRALGRFVGYTAEQEDDITMVSVRRHRRPDEVLDEFTVCSSPCDERGARERVVEVAADAGLEPRARDRLGTAVAEAVMNAAEHGNASDPNTPVGVRVLATATGLAVEVVDRARGGPAPGADEAEVPDLAAKLEGLQSPRGWGLFLMRSMVDGLTEYTTADGHHVVRLVSELPAAGEVPSGGRDDAGDV